MFFLKFTFSFQTAKYKNKLKEVRSEVKEEIFLVIREENTASA